MTPQSNIELPDPMPGVTEARGPGWVLRLGRWQDVLAGVVCDAVITDPPYGARTHDGQRHGRKDPRYGAPDVAMLSARGLGYAHWTPRDVREAFTSWSPRCRGWIAVLTSHDLIPHWSLSSRRTGRYDYAPIACVQNYMNVRLAGDGPSNWTCWMHVSRPRTLRSWGALPGAYTGDSFDRGENGLDRSKRAVPGGKPVWLMRALVRDYSRPNDLICDPCAGGATTLRAAVIEGRRAIGAEMDPKTFDLAVQRLEGVGPASETQPNLFRGAVR